MTRRGFVAALAGLPFTGRLFRGAVPAVAAMDGFTDDTGALQEGFEWRLFDSRPTYFWDHGTVKTIREGQTLVMGKGGTWEVRG